MYDCQAWKDAMGPIVRRGNRALITRMGFLFCVDGVPAFHQKHKGSPTLTIAELINLSLAPHIRYDPDNMN